MKNLSIALLIAISLSCFAQESTDLAVSNFEIQLTYDEEHVYMDCENCVWTSLTFALKKNEVRYIDQHGVSLKNQEHAIASTFRFSLEREAEGMKARSFKGTDWDNLGFTGNKVKLDKEGVKISPF